jgi:hypothetical protein
MALHETSHFSSKVCSGLADGIWKLSWKGTKVRVRTNIQLGIHVVQELQNSPWSIYKGNHGTRAPKITNIWLGFVGLNASAREFWGWLVEPRGERHSPQAQPDIIWSVSSTWAQLCQSQRLPGGHLQVTIVRSWAEPLEVPPQSSLAGNPIMWSSTSRCCHTRL